MVLVQAENRIIAPNGQEYSSVHAMCKDYGVPYPTYKKRLVRGLTMTECLEVRKIKDHTGKEFTSVKAMLYHYGIYPPTFYKRIESGWSLEQALTTPMCESKRPKKKEGKKPKPFRSVEVQDHLGNTFESTYAMCAYWGLSNQCYYSRIGSGLSLQEALTKPVKEHRKKKLK